MDHQDDNIENNNNWFDSTEKASAFNKSFVRTKPTATFHEEEHASNKQQRNKKKKQNPDYNCPPPTTTSHTSFTNQ